MQPKKHYFAHIPTIAIFIVFAMSAPLGVLLFILKSIDKNAENGCCAGAGRLSFRPRPRTCADGSPAGKRANLRPRCSHQRAEGCQGAS